MSLSGAAASHAEGADGRRLCQPFPTDDGVERGPFLVVDSAVGGEAVARDRFAILGMPRLDIVGGVADHVVLIDASHAAIVATPVGLRYAPRMTNRLLHSRGPEYHNRGIELVFHRGS